MAKRTRKVNDKPREKIVSSEYLQHINPHAAGIDVGSSSHHVAAPLPSGEIGIREFSAFTPDLYALARWLKENKVTTVAMEATGVYWIPLYDLLEELGFEVKLVNARHVKNVTGRKTDVEDCQWLQQLHACGLLQGSFRPDEKILPLRTYSRQRNMIIKNMTPPIHHMQKALSQMNIQLHNVLSDITGATGMKIVRAIVAGERDPKILAGFRNYRCRSSKEIIEKSLTGHWRAEHLFALEQALKAYDFYQQQLLECDQEIERTLQELTGETLELGGISSSMPKPRSHRKSRGNSLYFNATLSLKRLTGVDLTKIPGIDSNTALKVVSELGLDMSRWRTAKHLTSWLGVSPENKISGGRLLSSKTKPTANRVAIALRMAASTLHRSPCALGAYLRRLKARVGPAKAITATANKLAVILYAMLKKGEEYVEAGLMQYETQYKERLLKGLKKRAHELGFTLVALPEHSHAQIVNPGSP